MRDRAAKIYLYKRIVQAKLFIDHQYGEPIDLANISGEAHFSKFHFIRLFKTIYGKTPHQYLTAVRLEAAKKLLQEGMSVTSSCFTVGFDSLPSFTALFRRHTALSPSAYQQKHIKRQAEIKKAPLRFIPACFAGSYGWSENSNFGEV